MNEFSFTNVVQGVLASLTQSVVQLAPRMISALVVFLIGYIIARIVQRVCSTGLSRLRFDVVLDRLGITRMLKKIGLQMSPSVAVAKLVYFLIVILFAQAAADSVGLVAISGAIRAFFAYLPKLIAAIVILLLGNVIAEMASAAVRQSAKESGIDYAEALGKIVSALIFFVVVVMAVTQLGIETDIIKAVAITLLGGGSLAFALTFGLGTRDITRNIMAGFYARKLFQSGENIEIGGESGKLIAITPINTLIEREEKVISIPNRAFLDTVVKQ